MPVMPEYVWLVVMGAIAAFGFGWATGANDVANAFGTSVGAKTLTLRQATIIAAVFEFAGALLLGRVVTGTIAGGISDPKVFQNAPEIYAYGMVCAMGVGAIWQGIASWAGFNVSATHSIIGGIIGFSLVYKGGSAVQWATPDPKSFPPYKGVVPIVMSWFFSPVLTGAASAFIFWLVRTAVLRRKNSRTLAYWVLPVAVGITTFVNVIFVLTKGAAKSLGADFTTGIAAGISAGCAGGLALITAVIVVPVLRRRQAKQAEEAANAEAEANVKNAAISHDSEGPIEARADKPWYKRAFRAAQDAALYGTSVDIHQVVEEDPVVAAMHANAEQFDPATEQVFGYLQVFSAIAVIFAHGAGEVGFMAGPLSAIYDIYQTGNLAKNVSPPIWCILLSAISLVIGLATYGYNVTRAMGVTMAKLTPSRGFAAELATALVILIASQLGLPTSSSQCITGGIVGVGILEGAARGVNWKHFAKQFASWVATLLVVGLGVGALFAQGIYSPSKIDGRMVAAYEKDISALSGGIASSFNESLVALRPAAEAGALKQLSLPQWEALNETVAGVAKAANVSNKGFVSPSDVVGNLQTALGLVQNNTVFTLGQNRVYPGSLSCNGQVADNIKRSLPAICPMFKLMPADAGAQ